MGNQGSIGCVVS